ncbi:MAG: ABC transporter permease [Acholeplasmatales bacterium]|nr:ABC transporter permease [Acholeplasmatales bacterium]
MKFVDRYKISLHNISNNKSRSILTTIIVYIISFLIMAIMCIAITYYVNQNKIIYKYYETVGETNISYNNYNGDKQGKKFNKDLYVTYKNVIDKHSKDINYIEYSINNMYDVGLTDYSYPIKLNIIEGTGINKSIKNSNKIYVSSNYVSQYYNNYGKQLSVGSKFIYNYSYSPNNKTYENEEIELEIAGIYKAEKKNNYNIKNVYIDCEYVLNNFKYSSISSFNIEYNIDKISFDSSRFKNELKSLYEEIKEIMPLSYNRYTNGNNEVVEKEYESVNCSVLEDLKMYVIIGYVILGFAGFLAIVLMLLSIGSLANTIVISVNKNKKFIGLMKALGLNERDLKSTIKYESMTTIIIGVLLAFGSLYIIKAPLTSISSGILESTFTMYLAKIKDYAIIMEIPIYVPILTIIFFILFTLLFSKSSMSKISKTDPMAVISEVS